MNVTLQCGRCKKRWRYSGSSPTAALAAHREKEHPDEVIGPGPGEHPPDVERGSGEED